MSEKYQDYTDIPKPTGSTEDIVQQKKTRIIDNIAKGVTLLLAFLFWLYVFATNDATKVEVKTFELVPIEVRGSETLESYNLTVQNMSFFNIDVKLKGTRGALSGVKNSDIKAYINVSNITDSGVYYLTVFYDIPTGLSDAPMDTKTLEITVDTISEKNFTLDASKVFVDSFVLPDSCAIDADGITLNASSLTVEGPTMVLNRINDIRVRPSEALTLTGSTTLTLSVEALDERGEAVSLSSCKIIAIDSAGKTVENITATIPVYQEKLLPIVIKEENSLLTSDKIALSVSEVYVRGTVEKMKELTAIELNSFSVTKFLTGEAGTAAFDAPIPLKYKDYRITDHNGKTVSLVQVTLRLVKEKTITLDASYVKIINGSAEVDTSSIQVIFRATHGNEALLSKFLLEASEGRAAISINVDLGGKTITKATSVEAEIVFLDEYFEKLYAISQTGVYTVTVKPVLR